MEDGDGVAFAAEFWLGTYLEAKLWKPLYTLDQSVQRKARCGQKDKEDLALMD